MEKSDRRHLSMQEIQQVSLEILKYIKFICEKNNFRYCLIYGTLLGAVRHGGYIPWDDDVDIMMPRPDYERFLIYMRNNSHEYYKIFNRDTKREYIYAISRLCDTRYEIIKEDERNCGMGIFVDIYPYDGLGNSREEALPLLRKTRKYCDSIVSVTRKFKTAPRELNYKGKLVYYFSLAKKMILGEKFYHNKLQSLTKRHKYDESKYVGPVLWYFSPAENVLFDRTSFEKLKKIKFEDDEFYVPEDYDKVLTTLYGEYMQLPPEEKRIYHHQYKAYKKI